jgi:hypothetical protein
MDGRVEWESPPKAAPSKMGVATVALISPAKIFGLKSGKIG